MAEEISHHDLYLQLGELKGMVQALTQANSNFVDSFRALTTRMDRIESRQNTIEATQSTQKGGVSLAAWAVPIFVTLVFGVIALLPIRDPNSSSAPEWLPPKHR
jgi:hypothetical protein